MRWVAVVPFYNCENYIAGTISSFGLSHFQVFERVILIDNASSDKSLEKAKEAIARHILSEKFVLLKNRVNYGLGGTFKVGVRKAKELGYTHFCFFHGDGQTRLTDLLKFVQVFRDKPDSTAVFGSRFMWSSKRKNYSWTRTVANYFLNFLYSFFSKRRISDIGSGFNVYKLEDLELSFIDHLSNSMVFDAELLLSFIDQKKKFFFVPIQWNGTAHKNFLHNMHFANQVLRILFAWRFGLWQSRSHHIADMTAEEII